MKEGQKEEEGENKPKKTDWDGPAAINNSLLYVRNNAPVG